MKTEKGQGLRKNSEPRNWQTLKGFQTNRAQKKWGSDTFANLIVKSPALWPQNRLKRTKLAKIFHRLPRSQARSSARRRPKSLTKNCLNGWKRRHRITVQNPSKHILKNRKQVSKKTTQEISRPTRSPTSLKGSRSRKKTSSVGNITMKCCLRLLRRRNTYQEWYRAIWRPQRTQKSWKWQTRSTKTPQWSKKPKF